ncbi:hypothetical protein D3C78_989210 [compost metagenome]
MTFYFATVVQVSFDTWYVDWRWQVINNCIQHKLDTFVTIRRSAHNREDFNFYYTFTKSCFQLINSDFFTFKVFHSQIFIKFSNLLDQLCTKLFNLCSIISRNFSFLDVLAQIIFVHVSLLSDDVDNTDKIILCTDRQLNRHCICLQTVAHIFNYVKIVSTDDIHFVDISDTRNAIFVSLSPYSFRLRLYAFLRTEHAYCPVQYTQGTFNFYCEVNVSRGIDDIYAVTFPLSGRRSGSNRNSALLFLFHPVHCCRTFVNFTDFVRNACVEQDTFRRGSFTGVNMRHDPDITCIFQGELSCHEFVSLQNINLLGWTESYQR